MLAVIHRQRIKQLEIAVEALNPATVEKETYEMILEHTRIVEELQEQIRALTDQLRKEQQENRREEIPPWEDTNGTERFIEEKERGNKKETDGGATAIL